jgi:hypothetical protein
METQSSGEENDQGEDDIFIAVDGRNRAVWGWWHMTMVQIQCFSFDSRGETTRQSVTERRSGGSELVLTQWEGNVMTLGRGDAAPGRGKGGDEVS